MIRDKILKKINGIIEIQHESFSDHSQNVSKYAFELAKQIMRDNPELKLEENFPEYLRLSALVHDIGKLFIPIEVLAKPNTLSEEEYFFVQNHTKHGDQLLDIIFYEQDLTNEEKILVSIFHDVCLGHHERLDGSGYPYKRKEDKIPLTAQIIAIVDSFDAMTCDRCYKISISKEKALSILQRETDKYNEKLLNSFEKVIKNNFMEINC